MAYTYANNNPTTFSDPTGLLYYVDNDNATIPRLQGHDDDNDPVAARADQRAHNNTFINAKAKLNSPARNKQGQAMPGGGLDSLRAGYDYHGSNDFTYADAIDFASQGPMQWAIVCQWMTGSSTDCRIPSRSAGEILKSLAKFAYELTPIADAVHCVSGQDSCLWLLTNIAAPLKGLKVIDKLDNIAKEADHLADTARAACSFTGDTEVLMADGTHKPIKDIQVGDQVLATNPEIGENGPRKVNAVWIHQDATINLVTDDGATIATTRNHPFYSVTDRSWRRADQFGPGDRLLTASGQSVVVSRLQIGAAGLVNAYNLTIDRVHTYYVGSDALLVHNTCGPTPNATVRDLLELTRGNPLEAARSKARLSDERLLDSVFNPIDGTYGYMKASKSGTLLDGNHRAEELIKRAADPNNHTITWDTPIYVQGFR